VAACSGAATLSRGALAGIVVAALVGAVALVACAVVVWCTCISPRPRTVLVATTAMPAVVTASGATVAVPAAPAVLY